MRTRIKLKNLWLLNNDPGENSDETLGGAGGNGDQDDSQGR